MKKVLSVGTLASCTAASLLSSAAVLAGPEPQPVTDRVVWDGNVPMPRGVDGDPFLPCALNIIDNCQPFEYPRVAATSYGSNGAAFPVPCDFNGVDGVNSQDFFDFLAAFFASLPSADFNGMDGVNSQDFFDFLACFFNPPPVVTTFSLNRVADHFRPSASGSVASVCWWGTYGGLTTACVAGEPDQVSDDNFVITYYNRNPVTGLPSTQIAQFVQDRGTLTVTGRRFLCDSPGGRRSVSLTATHAPVPVLGLNCYFIEIRNAIGAAQAPAPGVTGWFWSRTSPQNDNVCYRDITSNGYTADEAAAGDRAFCVGIFIDALNSQQCLPPTTPPPPNDDCTMATAVSGPTTVAFDTSGATATTDGQTNNACRDQYLPAQDASIFKDAWWVWTAAGAGVPAGGRIDVVASICGGVNWDAKMAAYAGGACPPSESDLLDCIDEMCEVAEGVATAQAEVRFTAVVGNQYLIQLGGAGVTQGSVGSLTFSVRAATGSCCVGGGRCLEVTSTVCAGLGGTYGGDNSDCNGAWTATLGAAAFEDIGATGTVIAGLNDDNGAMVTIPFTVYFDNEPYTELTVAVNGHVAFRPFAGTGPLYGFANSWDIDPANIPHQIMPNAYIAVAQDDLYVAPGGCGNVVFETLGAAPNRRFIVQWNHICGFSFIEDNHFQVVLFENSNDIECRYALLTPAEINPVGDTPDVLDAYVMGIETLSGANTIKVNPATVVPPVSLRYSTSTPGCP